MVGERGKAYLVAIESLKTTHVQKRSWVLEGATALSRVRPVGWAGTSGRVHTTYLKAKLARSGRGRRNLGAWTKRTS